MCAVVVRARPGPAPPSPRAGAGGGPRALIQASRARNRPDAACGREIDSRPGPRFQPARPRRRPRAAQVASHRGRRCRATAACRSPPSCRQSERPRPLLRLHRDCCWITPRPLLRLHCNSFCSTLLRFTQYALLPPPPSIRSPPRLSPRHSKIPPREPF